jgi:3-oxoacyl-[acyl-carrier protein] reductase
MRADAGNSLTAHATCIADVANAVLFFANPKSNFITGQALYVDGGVFTQSNWPY